MSNDEILFPVSVGPIRKNEPFLEFDFLFDRDRIAKLSMDKKQEWYAHQIQEASKNGMVPIQFTSSEFTRWWYWHYVLPLKIKRWFYRLKSGQLFKRYKHISEIKKEREKSGGL